MHLDYNVFEGIRVDFIIIVLIFFHNYTLAPRTVTQLAFSNNNTV